MKLRYILLVATIASSSFAIPAFAGTYNIKCNNMYSGESVTVKNVSANSRAAAVEKVRNDPSYGQLENCK